MINRDRDTKNKLNRGINNMNKNMPKARRCSEPTCNKFALSNGLCNRHWWPSLLVDSVLARVYSGTNQVFPSLSTV